jgi:hypothetical protein
LTAAEVDAIFVDVLPTITTAPVIGLDIGLTKDASVLAIARAQPGGLVVIEGLETWAPRPGTKVDPQEVEGAVADFALRLPCARGA